VGGAAAVTTTVAPTTTLAPTTTTTVAPTTTLAPTTTTTVAPTTTVANGPTTTEAAAAEQKVVPTKTEVTLDPETTTMVCDSDCVTSVEKSLGVNGGPIYVSVDGGTPILLSRTTANRIAVGKSGQKLTFSTTVNNVEQKVELPVQRVKTSTSTSNTWWYWALGLGIIVLFCFLLVVAAMRKKQQLRPK
jgi:hypothetical protein